MPDFSIANSGLGRAAFDDGMRRGAHVQSSEAERDRQRLLIPSAHDAHLEYEQAARARTAAQDGQRAATRELAERQTELDASTGRIDAVRTRIREMTTSKDERLAREADAIRNGLEVPTVSSVFVDREVERLERHVGILAEPLAGLRAAVDEAAERLGRAQAVEQRAARELARAEVVSVAGTLVPALVNELLPAIGRFKATAPEASDLRRLFEQLTRSLSPILSSVAVDALGRGPKPIVKSTAQSEEPTITLVVRQGENYGGSPGGARVEVSESEGVFQLRRDPTTNRPIGALMTVAEHEAEMAQIAHVQVEREEARGIVPRIKSLVDEGLARLSAQGRAEAAAKAEAEERRRRSDENLARLVEHQLAAAASTAEERAMRVVLEQQGDNE